MKTCQDIEALLPFYSEGALSPEEKSDVEKHLATCLRCRKELAYLQKAGRLTSDMPAVEAPPWFQKKVMAEVRKEAEKKEGARKWFYPLRIRIPIRIMATVVLSVLAVYIYRSGEDRMKQVLPGVGPPAAVLQKDEARPEKPPEPRAAAPSIGPQADAFSKEAGKDQGVSTSTPHDGEMKKPVKPGGLSESLDDAKAGRSGDATHGKKQKPFEVKASSEEQISEKGDVAPPVQDVPPEERAEKAEVSAREKIAGERAVAGTAKQEQKAKKSANGGLGQATAPAAPSSLAASADAETNRAAFVVHVRDIRAAELSIEKMLSDYGAKITSRHSLPGRTILYISIPAKQLPSVVSGLKDIGQVYEKVKRSEEKVQMVPLILEVIAL